MIDGLVRVQEIVLNRDPVGVHAGFVPNMAAHEFLQDRLGCGRHHSSGDLIRGPVLRSGHGGLAGGAAPCT